MKKNNIFSILGIALLVVLVSISSCKEEEYDFNKMIPGIAGITGPTNVTAGGFVASQYEVVAARTNSVYTWAVVGHTFTIAEVKNKSWAADITFDQASVAVHDVQVIVTETTQGGLTATDTIIVDLAPLCPLNGAADYAGTWIGTDAGYASQITATADGDDVVLDGVNAQWIVDGWGETITAGGTCAMTINYDDGTVEIPQQYIFNTLWSGSDYVYEIAGEGLWDNCGSVPTITLNYDLYNVTDDYWVNGSYAFVIDISVGTPVKKSYNMTIPTPVKIRK